MVLVIPLLAIFAATLTVFAVMSGYESDARKCSTLDVCTREEIAENRYVSGYNSGYLDGWNLGQADTGRDHLVSRGEASYAHAIKFRYTSDDGMFEEPYVQGYVEGFGRGREDRILEDAPQSHAWP